MKKDNGTHRIRKGILAVFMNLILIIFSLSLIATGSPFKAQVHAASQSAGQTLPVNSGKQCVFSRRS